MSTTDTERATTSANQETPACYALADPPCGHNRQMPDPALDLLSATGDRVSVVEVRYSAGAFLLTEMRSWRGRLTSYFFLDRGRDATLVVGDLLVHGRLATRWGSNHRVWQLLPRSRSP